MINTNKENQKNTITLKVINYPYNYKKLVTI